MEKTPPTFPPQTHAGNQPDEYVKCPYFPEHELRRSRLPYHIIKCQKNPRAPKLVICPFNALHRVKLEDREEHMILCEDRILVKYADREPVSYLNTEKQLFGHVGPAKPMRIQEDKTGQKNDSTEEWW